MAVTFVRESFEPRDDDIKTGQATFGRIADCAKPFIAIRKETFPVRDGPENARSCDAVTRGAARVGWRFGAVKYPTRLAASSLNIQPIRPDFPSTNVLGQSAPR